MNSASETRWQRGKLGDLLPLKYGKGLPEKARDSSGSVLVFGSSGKVGRHSEPLTCGPTLIVGRKGTVGAVHLSLEACWPIDTVYFAEPDQGQNLKYYKYLLDSLNLARLDRSTAVPGLSRDDYNAVEVTVAPHVEQERIVAEIEKQFSRLDEAVANLKRVKANLKRYRAAVLRAAVTGELVETRAETADIAMATQESGAELLDRVLRARRVQWSGRGSYSEPIAPDITDLPQLPKGWVWASADQLSDFITKGTTPAADLLSEGAGEVQFLKVCNLTFDGTLNRGYKPTFVRRRTHERDLARSKVRPGDVLINIVGPPLGQVGVVPDDLLEANINQAIARIRPIAPLSARFMAICLMADVVMGRAIQRAKTTAGQANLTLELCRALPIPLPPLDEQQRIAAQVDRLLSFADQVEATISLSDDRAKTLRMATLSSAFEPQHP